MKKFYTCLAALIVLNLSACQTIKKAPELVVPSASSTQQSFKVTGKIGIKTPEQSGSAFYGWSQQGEHFAIELTGALGIGQTSIQGSSGHVSLTSSKTGTIVAETPEELLYIATKWEAPITYLISWINAKSATTQAQTTYDIQQRISTIKEAGWTVDFSYSNQDDLPNKLVLVDDAQQNRVTLTIMTRE